MLASNDTSVIPITFVSTHQTASRRVLHKKLTAAQPTKNWSNFYGTVTFTTVAQSPELDSTQRQLYLHTQYLSDPLLPSSTRPATWFPPAKHQQRFAITRSWFPPAKHQQRFAITRSWFPPAKHEQRFAITHSWFPPAKHQQRFAITRSLSLLKNP